MIEQLILLTIVHLFWRTFNPYDSWFREVVLVRGLFQYKQSLTSESGSFPNEFSKKQVFMGESMFIFTRRNWKWATYTPSHLFGYISLGEGPVSVAGTAPPTLLMDCFLFALFSRLMISEPARLAGSCRGQRQNSWILQIIAKGSWVQNPHLLTSCQLFICL